MVQLPVPNKAGFGNHQHISRMGEKVMAKREHRMKELLNELAIISLVVVTSILLIAHMVINVLITSSESLEKRPLLPNLPPFHPP